MNEPPTTREISTRPIAKLYGKTRYYTGRLCTHGHDAERYTCSGACVECLRPLWRRARANMPNRTIRVYLSVPTDTTDDLVLRLSQWLQASCVSSFLDYEAAAEAKRAYLKMARDATP